MRTPSLIITALAGLIVNVSVAHASTVTFVTPPGSTAGGQPVDALATFAASVGALSVTLEDLQANPTNVVQLISDLSFTLSSGNSAAGSSLASSDGQEIRVNSNGTFTLGSGVDTGWAYSTSGSTMLSLNVLGGPTAPAHLIIGPPGPGGLYSNADGSIAGNTTHNPFLFFASFTIDGSGLTPAAIPSSVTFSFGTAPGVDVTGTPAIVPLPAALPLFATGLGALGLLGWRKKRKAA